ncbi:hypothetical protein CANARDRAFT_76356 [[Candida] arabinofermentans NRRL YB-2248]|uniref:Uncharacterized protein n=1 Tax=[Candida] arabinofermentans NRRL YB-2248 TaxID=983967 RepID=A0A1E4SWC9_9ASCO|nr:hypothetical protein CANARDRAFT_76356 [[Candida] arabinofermentans NRRL YB-2248]
MHSLVPRSVKSLSPKSYLRLSQVRCNSSKTLYTNRADIASSKIGEFNPDDVIAATNAINEILLNKEKKLNNPENPAIKANENLKYQSPEVKVISRSEQSRSRLASFCAANSDAEMVLDSPRTKHDVDPTPQAPLPPSPSKLPSTSPPTPSSSFRSLKSPSTLSPYDLRLSKEKASLHGPVSRYVYDAASDKVIDKSKHVYSSNIAKIANLQLNVSKKLSFSEKMSAFWEPLSKFPVLLLLRFTTSSISIPLKELTDLIETMNRSYNATEQNDDARFLDPNYYKLVADYFITDELTLLKAKLSENDHTFDISPFKSHHGNDMIILGISQESFKATNQLLNYLRSTKSDVTKKFEVNSCVLNVPEFPVLAKIKEAEKDERIVMEENLYSIAALGLVKVNKSVDGRLVLTKKRESSLEI